MDIGFVSYKPLQGAARVSRRPWDLEASVGEYGLALDEIAYAYLSSATPMPGHLFRVFERLAVEMEMEGDAEYADVARLRAETRACLAWMGLTPLPLRRAGQRLSSNSRRYRQRRHGSGTASKPVLPTTCCRGRRICGSARADGGGPACAAHPPAVPDPGRFYSGLRKNSLHRRPKKSINPA